MKIFEIAKIEGGVRHYIWSNLDYSLGVSDRESVWDYSLFNWLTPHIYDPY